MAPIDSQDQGLYGGVLVDVWVVLVREMWVSDFTRNRIHCLVKNEAILGVPAATF